MLKLTPFTSTKIWGYENWCASTHPAGVSIPPDERRDPHYPLIVKVIQADMTLSVQVHPDDEYAREHENSGGKFECWYVLDAEPGAEIVAGIKPGLSRDDVRNAFSRNRQDDALNRVRVSRGSFVEIPPGIVHAIGGGIRILEVQQCSDITYRLYDWGRGRELHVRKAFDVMKPLSASVREFGEEFPPGTPFRSPYFSLETIVSSEGASLDCPENTALFVLDGRGIVKSGDGKKIDARKEDTLFFPEGGTAFVPRGVTLMKILPARAYLA
jgi:mannose-6-phosphate isomerase